MFVDVNAGKKNTPEIHFIYLRKKEILLCFWDILIASDLFSTKYSINYNFIFLFK